jgi:MFS family permease
MAFLSTGDGPPGDTYREKTWMSQTSLSLRKHLGLEQTFAALQYRNYRLWFFGQMTSLFGTWMQSTAQGYLAFELTHSTAFLGYVSFASGLPSWLLILFGGVVADRVPRRWLIVVTQTLQMLLAFVLALLAFLRVVQPWHIIALAFLLGVTNAFDTPARQSFVLELVERQHLTNAIALNSTMFNTAVVVGPAAAGLAYAAFGPAWCFFLNGVSFIAVIVALILMRLKPPPVRTRHTSALIELQEGLRYTMGQPIIRALVAMMSISAVFGVSYGTLFPAWAVEVLHGDATTNGLLVSARGVGSLIAALFIASTAHAGRKGRILTLGTFLFPVTLLGFALARSLPASLFFLVAAGGAQVLFGNLANALVQAQSADELRGRVMAIYSLTFMGLQPLGGLLVGVAAQGIGEPITVALAAVISLALAVGMWVRAPAVRALD